MAGALLVSIAVSDGPYVSASAPFDRHALRVVLRSRGTRLAMLGYFGHMWELYAMWTWIAAFAAASLQSATGRAGSAVAFVAIASGSVGCVLAGRWADQLGKARVAGAAMLASAACALLSPLFYGGSLDLLLALAIVWGFTVVADSAQFSACVTELGDPRYIGTALTMQTCIGFLITTLTIRLLPLLVDAVGWRYAFAFLAPGPFLGIVAMLRLRSLPEAVKIAGGKR